MLCPDEMMPEFQLGRPGPPIWQVAGCGTFEEKLLTGNGVADAAFGLMVWVGRYGYMRATRSLGV